MWNEWTYWLSSQHPSDLLWILAGLFLVDGPRYAILSALVVLYEALRELFAWRGRSAADAQPLHCPSVCVLLVGHNEADTIYATLQSIWGTWHKLQIIVVDDGSTDGMASQVRQFEQTHGPVTLLSRPERGGKSSGLNWGLHYATADIVVTVDADSRIAPDAIARIVQPFRDPKIGAVSGVVRVWNQTANLLTRFQAYEYRQTILVGRAIQARFGLLGIVSGAFGAFRRTALQQIRGWDVGPGEDGDVVLRLRRSGYQVTAASDAECFTRVPETAAALARQRRRWDRTVVTFEARKHASSACFWHRGFRMADFLFMVERWFFNIGCVYAFWAFVVWLTLTHFNELLFLTLVLYLCLIVFELIQFVCLFWFSRTPLRDLRQFPVVLLMPMYHSFLKGVDLYALTEEFLFRASSRDDFVPEKIRRATWQW